MADKLVTIHFGKKEYYDAQNLLEIPFLSMISDNIEELRLREKIPEENYLVARFSKTKKIWTMSSDVKKLNSTYLFEKKWIDKNMEYLFTSKEISGFRSMDNIEENTLDEEVEINDSDADSDDESDESASKYPPAPPEIMLSKEENMKDSEGKQRKILVLGLKEMDGCYFKLNDVAKWVNLPNLRQKFYYKNTIYKKNVHYVRFICSNKLKSETEKPVQIFLTYLGMYNAIHDKKIICNTNVSINLSVWLKQFYGKGINENYIFDFDITKIKDRSGYVYCVSSSRLFAIKIGYTRSSEESLRARYATYYGKDIEIKLFWTKNPSELETQCHERFAKHRIMNELFDIAYQEDYYIYLRKNAKEII